MSSYQYRLIRFRYPIDILWYHSTGLYFIFRWNQPLEYCQVIAVLLFFDLAHKIEDICQKLHFFWWHECLCIVVGNASYQRQSALVAGTMSDCMRLRYGKVKISTEIGLRVCHVATFIGLPSKKKWSFWHMTSILCAISKYNNTAIRLELGRCKNIKNINYIPKLSRLIWLFKIVFIADLHFCKKYAISNAVAVVAGGDSIHWKQLLPMISMYQRFWLSLIGHKIPIINALSLHSLTPLSK